MSPKANDVTFEFLLLSVFEKLWRKWLQFNQENKIWVKSQSQDRSVMSYN